jgi:hypothetical protein
MFKDKVFDWPGLPVKKSGILFAAQTCMRNTFSRKDKFLATVGGGLKRLIRSFYSKSTIASYYFTLNPNIWLTITAYSSLNFLFSKRHW